MRRDARAGVDWFNKHTCIRLCSCTKGVYCRLQEGQFRGGRWTSGSPANPSVAVKQKEIAGCLVGHFQNVIDIWDVATDDVRVDGGGDESRPDEPFERARDRTEHELRHVGMAVEEGGDGGVGEGGVAHGQKRDWTGATPFEDGDAVNLHGRGNLRGVLEKGNERRMSG